MGIIKMEMSKKNKKAVTFSLHKIEVIERWHTKKIHMQHSIAQQSFEYQKSDFRREDRI